MESETIKREVENSLTKIYDRDGHSFSLYLYKGIPQPALPVVPSVLANISSLPLRADDIVISAYPTAGTHWIWEVTSMIVNGRAERIPSIKEENMIDFMLKDQLDSKPSPRVLNTHLHPTFLPETLLKNNKIIFIARNPKSVVVSYYRHMWSIEIIQYDGNFHSFFELFMDGNVPSGDYFEYTRQWWPIIKDNPNVLIITYEEASKDLVKIVSLIAKFLGKEIDEQLIKDIADMCTFDRMKKEKISVKEDVFKINFKDNSGFFRSGKVSTWKEWMTVAQNERMDARIQKELLEQGINLNIF
ncbi:sulfotransferase 1A2 [Octopus sinensis]|uniref:Sulfotransferase 1A2 n=1 Tax=Octopus sinensis TaxID=2607531 RepID=A0A6P7S7Q6_9MOLL|nr:sulfotransferase 1A2 [Octopus sinensis]